MKKFFTFVLPDEPYKNTTELNQVVNAVYEGNRYLAVRVNPQTDIVEGVIRSNENLEDLDQFLSTYKEEGYLIVVIDAAVHPFEAAYITGDYTHDIIEDPTYELPRGLGTWTYHYDDYTGGISQAFYQFTLKYNGGRFSGPDYRMHAVTRESLFEGAKLQAKTIEESLKVNDYTDEDRKTLEDYAKWLKDLPKTYEGVDHWKITFPTNVPKY